MYERAGFEHVNSGPPTSISKDVLQFRKKFIMEEFDEWVNADVSADLVLIADALADMVIVVMGTAHCYHIPLDRVLHAVMDANDDKRTGVTDRGHKNDLIKPEGWIGPEVMIKSILKNHQPKQNRELSLGED